MAKRSKAASGGLSAHSSAADRWPEILSRLRAAHPDARCELDHRSPFELLVATILSAQCTDDRVNQVTPGLFRRYPDAAAFAAADRAELEEAIRSTGFFRQKARFIQEASRRLVADHGGAVPGEMADLLELPGVARKTANVVLGVAFGKAEGVVVDTHVKRVARRLGLTSSSDPEKIEQDLMKLADRETWIELGHLLIFHGRRICTARRPSCPDCLLVQLCPSAQL